MNILKAFLIIFLSIEQIYCIFKYKYFKIAEENETNQTSIPLEKEKPYVESGESQI
jgi:hypothetical protein